MSKLETNLKIINQVKDIIAKKGYEGKLLLEPVQNTATKRPKFGQYKDGTIRFSMHLWDVNSLTEPELTTELESRVNSAICYFKSEGKL